MFSKTLICTYANTTNVRNCIQTCQFTNYPNTLTKQTRALTQGTVTSHDG